MIVLGAFTFWPLIYMFLAMGLMAIAVLSNSLQSGPESGLLSVFGIMFVLHLFTTISTLVLISFYIVYLFRTDRVAQDKKALWAVVLFFGNVIAMPVFWFNYIWREPDPAPQHTATIGNTPGLKDLLIAFGACAAIGLLISYLAMYITRGDPLHNAAKDGDLNYISKLLDSGVAVDRADEEGTTALCEAAAHGQTEAVGFLLQAGANPNVTTRWGYTPMHMAAAGGHLEVAKLLHKHKADFDFYHERGITPLWQACREGNYEVAKYLIELGADLDVAMADSSPLHIAPYSGELELIKLLVEAGAEVNALDRRRFNPMRNAIMMDRADIVSYLLEKGSDPYIIDTDGRNALDYSREKYIQAENAEKVLANFMQLDSEPE